MPHEPLLYPQRRAQIIKQRAAGLGFFLRFSCKQPNWYLVRLNFIEFSSSRGRIGPSTLLPSLAMRLALMPLKNQRPL